MLRIEYRASDGRAEISWDGEDENSSWLEMVRRLALDHDDSNQEDGFRISLPWWSFISLRSEFFEIFRGFNLTMGRDLLIGEESAVLLRQSTRNAFSYANARTAGVVSESDLRERLVEIGFTRELSTEQIRNVRLMASLPASATFSVPGAGKTTEALASYFYKREDEDRLLVIAPKNAFAAWDEQIHDCVPELGNVFTRLRGGRENISRLLEGDPRLMLISYQQLARIADLIAQHCSQLRTHIFLDESHRIKSGVGKQTARAVLSLSHLPVGKLIMSGTPMPQATDDLIPQLKFLYPEIVADADNVVDLIRPVYVRTTKTELGLPPITRQLIGLPMAPVQDELYRLMKFEVAREAASALSVRSKRAFRRLGRSVARLLQFVSNPSLLSSEMRFAHPDLLAAVLSEGDGPKVRYVLSRARSLARQGHKVLIWSSFVKNVEYLASRLSDLGAVYIHGGVDAGDESDDETREGKIKLFHDDLNVRVMIANPAAASEGVSLHRICHHAIYLDRTFNAAHYLQSEDRIHRFGLPPDQETLVEIVECLNTVDETVRERLNFKINKMAEALNDPSLRPDPIPLDPSDIEDFEEYSTGLSTDDVEALIRDLEEVS
jgi:SNF2 family DNA or RNA helicase